MIATRGDLLKKNDETPDDADDEAFAKEIVRREYVSGTCGAYAIALHDVTDHHIVGICGGLHIAIQLPDERIQDYMGISELKDIARHYGMNNPPIAPWTRDDVVEHILMGAEEGKDPWDDIAIARWVLEHRSREMATGR